MRKKTRSHFRRTKNVRHVNSAVKAREGFRSWVARAIWLSGRVVEWTYPRNGMPWPKAGKRRKVSLAEAQYVESRRNAMNLKQGRRRAAWNGAVG